ncbi:MAG: hypothetical protein AAFR96_13460 [Planctomycetota bacterium]
MTDHRPDPIESMLDSLGGDLRSEPDRSFEDRVMEAVHHRANPNRSSFHGSRGYRGRRLVLPAALSGLAAVVAAGVIVRLAMTAPAAPMSPAVASSLEEASLTLFDDAFGLSDSWAAAAEGDGDLVVDPGALDEWIVSGESL